MLPLFLLNSIKGEPIMIELKRGETINGVLSNCDSYMNLLLKDVVVSDAHGEKFYKEPEIYVKGIHIKYITMSNELIDKFREMQIRDKEEYQQSQHHNNNRQGYGNRRNYNRGGRGYSGRGGRGGYNNRRDR